MTRNLAASVRARLNTLARGSHRPFQEVLQYYGLERFLYRFSKSRHRERFLLKGALMLRVWEAPESRPTRDIDFLGFVENEITSLERIVREVCEVAVEDDGLVFDASTVAGERIAADAEYEGVRVRFNGFLENARIPMQVDVGFGDVVKPGADDGDYPTLLEFPAPHLRMYPRETLVAKKFQTMVRFGTVNSRMKDFFDVWLIARQFDFDGALLARAMSETFRNRGTEMESEPVALSSAFTTAESTQKQWAAFVDRSRLTSAPRTLDDIRDPLRAFLLPVAVALRDGREFAHLWQPPGPWRESRRV